ncbi:anchored repeat-type ABC transporter ATP-binding subunit [Cutibacterium sp. WCA-380-WT-3A]|uniref:Anchored repeat-type ABC transporter ATP-binding subunit n=1 Tax=Cutibacterium porci TaxID=2605781 RepID=A0A7K0J963_9ACTN|nr:anchored repeat-type ABC transporter ATP-binding subunit [Cutibacterium porci]MSS46501.1 anchored repeat-type ABC transporter ATP-binding subunit [Cutibacterium porci]
MNDLGSINLTDVAVNLGGLRVLCDVNLSAHEGDLLALLGPNGAGKTTMLRTMLGLVKPVTGTVDVAGTSPRKAWRHIGYVPQRHEFAWDFPISVAGVVMTGRTRHIGWLRHPGKADHIAVRDALRTVGMSELANRTVGELSGGQRQRVLIARALATRPSVLLLDEPFTGVDMPTQEMLTELLCRLSAHGTTLVMTTHDLGQAMVTADRVCLVNRTVIADSTPEKLRDPAVWMKAFGVSANSPLLAMVGAGESVHA